MDKTQIELKHEIESQVRQHFNALKKVNAQKKTLRFEQVAEHEFDLYDPQKVIGGITTSPWKNKTGSNNTGGQDRISAELLWLSVWEGEERRVMILTDQEMATKIFSRWKGCRFHRPVEIVCFNPADQSFRLIGKLSDQKEAE